jgi:thiol:disulfide interchange protein
LNNPDESGFQIEMVNYKLKIQCLLLTAALCSASAFAQNDANSIIIQNGNVPVELARYEQEYSNVRIKAANQGERMGMAVIFEGTNGLHYYADDTVGKKLQIKGNAKNIAFGVRSTIPQPATITDPSGSKVLVYAGNFTFFVPLLGGGDDKPSVSDVNVIISGQACTSDICLMPFEKIIRATIDWTAKDSVMQIPSIASEVQQSATIENEQKTYFVLSFLAGMALNIMPCVWPVLPLIIMRIISQAKHSKGRSILMGLTFCLGILSFFAILAGVNIVLKLSYHTVLQWGDQFRSPTFIAAMSLLLVLLATSMFGAFTITVPAAVSGRQNSGGGFFSTLGMGLLAAVLSTPCSFGILAASFAWAQTQPLKTATIVIMLIGAGMAAPYAVLTAIPGLMRRLPSPGRWMELFKQAVGFVLLMIAVKLINALPQKNIGGILYFAVVLAFSAWMWGKWVDFNTKPAKKWLVRFMAACLALVAGWTFLHASSTKNIDWNDYNANVSKLQSQIENPSVPVLIKFTADWCLSCQAVEKTVYSGKDIAALIRRKGVLVIKADTTEQDFPATKLLRQTYNEPGVPVSMLLVPGKSEPSLWRGILFGSQLKNKLEELPDKSNQ